MRSTFVLNSKSSFSREFSRCCRDYKTLSIAVAWCGSPKKTLPYSLLENFKGTISATVGISFNHTHPNAITWFSEIGADTRVFRDELGNLFHPKVYFFGDCKRYAIFVGSSNFTYGGFYSNLEINCLIEGTSSVAKVDDITSLENTLAKWRTNEWSFVPSKKWINKYRIRYREAINKQRKQKEVTPPLYEQNFSTASWLQHADWDTYYQRVLEGLKNHEGSSQGYKDILEAANIKLQLPWEPSYFNDIEKRRIMGGMNPYGWLGHVAASGQVRRLFVNGSQRQKLSIVNAVNAVAQLELPLSLEALKDNLNKLVQIGPTMKVWGRLLCLVRPDLYCTVSSDEVRKNLSGALGIPKNRIYSVDGYVHLIKLIHSTPWFTAQAPSDTEQASVWKRRAAYLDAIFY